MKKILLLVMLFAACNNANEVPAMQADTAYNEYPITHDTVYNNTAVIRIYDTVYIDSVDIEMIKVLKKSNKFTLEQIAKRFNVYPTFIKQF